MSSEQDGVVTGETRQGRGLVPKLRFPEFQDARAWEEKPLNKVCEVNPSNGELPESFAYIDLASVEAGKLHSINHIDRDGAPSRAQRLLQSGDILFQMVRPYQRNNLLFENDDGYFVASTGYAQLRANASNQFLYQVIHTDVFVDQVIAKCTGSNYPAINSSDLAAITLAAPKPAEQQKIADCLSSLDAVIAAEGDRLAALKDHKKGLMQMLFPAQGQTTPRLRFPEFEGAGEWESVDLGSVAEVKLGKMLDQKKAGSGEPYPYINNMAVRWNHIDTSNLPTMDFEARELDRFGLLAGDVLVCEGGEPGRAAVWSGIHNAIKFQKAIHRVRFKVPYAPELFATYLEAIASTDSFKSILTGEGIKHLTLENFLKLKIPMMEHAEHAKLNSTFMSVNSLLSAAEQRVHVLKRHKSALMQQLFPSPAEATA